MEHFNVFDEEVYFIPELSTAVSENNLLDRLEAFLPTPFTSRRPSIESISKEKKKKRLEKVHRLFTLKYLLDPQSTTYIAWLGIVSIWFVYNALVLPLREVFGYQDENNTQIWFALDSVADIFYVFDLLFFKCHIQFVQDGFTIETTKESRRIYSRTTNFKMDVLSLLPVDILTSVSYKNMPWLRLPRLLKITTFWELFERLDTRLASPFAARICKTLLYMLYMIHLNATAYYALSTWEGQGSTEWTFGYGKSGDGNAYVRCFYFATKTATSIGKTPRPSNEIEYLFMTFAWLSGVFIFALLIGQIRDIIATATKGQTDYRQVCYTMFNYLHRLDVPKHLQARVKSWLNYTWQEQKTLDEGMIISQLPQKMQADLALHVHILTLSKVKLFQNCETAFLRDLVVKLKSIIFLPGDYVCRKGEAGREMYIIRTGRVNVIGGPSGQTVLASLTAGSVFGEIALLGIGGMTKRTADVRTAGFSNLFVLNKADLNEAIKDYPQAQESLRKKAKKLIRENLKKRKLEAKMEAAKREEMRAASKFIDASDFDDENIIIKNKHEQPRLVETVLKAVRPSSMAAKYLKFGTKASSVDIPTEDNSYPPSPYLPASPHHLGQNVTESYAVDSSDDELNFTLPMTNGAPPPLNISTDEDEVVRIDAHIFDRVPSMSDDEGNDLKLRNSSAGQIQSNLRHESNVSSSSSSTDISRFPLNRQFSLDIDSDDGNKGHI